MSTPFAGALTVSNRRQNRKPSRRDERGTGLLEVVLTMSLFLLVLGALLESHTSFLFAAKRQEQSIDARATARFANRELSAVLRSAETVWAPSGTAEALNQITVTVPRRDGRSSEITRLRRDVGRAAIVREVLDAPDGRVVSERVIATSVVASREPFVRYFDTAGDELNPEKVTTAVLAGCSMRFRLEVAIAPGPGRPSVTSAEGITPRNRRAEELTC